MKNVLLRPRWPLVFVVALVPIACTSGGGGGGTSGGQAGIGGMETGGSGGATGGSGGATGGSGGATGGSGGATGGSGGATGGSGGAIGGSGGAPSSCTAANASVDCDDANACTDDTCPTGSCVHLASPNGVPCGVDMHCDGSGSCVSVTALWASRFGAAQDQSVHGIDVDPAGNVGLTGSYQNVIDFGGGSLPAAANNDGFAAKVDNTGKFVWNRAFSSAQQSAGNDIRFDGSGNSVTFGGFWATVDFGGGPLVSPSSPNMFAVKYAPDGSHVWSKRFGEVGGVGAFYESDVDEIGNVYLGASYSAGVVDFGCGPLAPAGGWDALVAKLDPMGKCIWSKRFGDGSFQQNSATAVDASGNVIVVGILEGTTDFGGGILASGGGQDVFVAKFDSDGKHIWSKRFGDGANQLGMAVATTKAGDIAVSGWFGGTLDFGGNPMTCAGGVDGYVAMLDAAGNHRWSKRIGGTNDDAVTALAVDKWGNVGITGFFRNTIDFGAGPMVSAGGIDMVLAKFSGADGKPLWSARFGDANNQVGTAIEFDSTGHAYVAGDFAGTVDVGTGPLVSTGGLDFFVAKFPP